MNIIHRTPRQTTLLARLGLALSLLAVAFCSHGLAQTANPTAVTNKIDVGGYKLQYASYGKGSPTVIIDSGLGDSPVDSGSWPPIINEVAKTTRVVVYNRAGQGESEPAKVFPRTSKDVAKDLHTLLTNAKITGPYILVGQSIGGMHLRVFAKEYPQDIAGMILVSSTHPDQFAQWLAALPPQSADEPESITNARRFLAEQMTSAANNPERLDAKTSCEQARAVKTLGNTPLIVLTHSPKWRMVPDLDDDLLKKLEDISQKLQVDLTKLSTQSKQVIAEKAGHHLHAEDPQLVIDAIREMVKQSAKPN